VAERIKVRTRPRVAFSFGQDTVSGEKCQLPTRACMADTYGCPLENSAKTKTRVFTNLQFLRYKKKTKQLMAIVAEFMINKKRKKKEVSLLSGFFFKCFFLSFCCSFKCCIFCIFMVYLNIYISLKKIIFIEQNIIRVF